MTRILILVALVVPALASAQTPEETFQRALRLERTQGDYAGAIALYESIAREADDRHLGARALIQLARAQENLGRADAAQTYRRVIADYAEITDMVAEARAGYARTREEVVDGLPSPFGETELKWTTDGKGSTTLTPSGRWVVGLAGSANRPDRSDVPFGIRMIEVATGDVRHIPVPGPADASSSYVKVSADDTEAVLVISATESDILTRVNLETGEVRPLVDLSDRFGCGWWHVGDWTSDRRTILLSGGYGNCTGEYREVIMTFDTEEEALTVAAELPEDEELAWEQVCFAGGNRFAFADMNSSGATFVRRIDLSTGESEVWRRRGDRTFLSACTWDPDQVLYAVEGVADVSVFAADPASDPDSEDIDLGSLSRDSYTQPGSKTGDLLVFDGHIGARQFVVANIDPDRREVGRIVEELGVGFARGVLDWSPDGTQLFWRAWQSGGGVRGRIWDASTGEEQIVETKSRMLTGGWVGEDTIWYVTVGPDTNYVHHLLNLATGEAHAVDQSALDREGMVSDVRPRGTNSWIGYDPDRQCLRGGDLKAERIADLHCFEKDTPKIGLLHSPFSEAVLVFAGSGEDQVAVGLLPAGGPGVRWITNIEDGRGLLSNSSWISDHVVAIRRAEGQGLVGMDLLNLESGTRSPILETLFEEVTVASIKVAPGLARLAAYLSWPEEAERLTVVHNVLGRD